MKTKLFTLLLSVMLLALTFTLVPMAAAEEANIELLYDDRKDLSTLVDAEGEVVITDEVVTSYQVGSTEKDPHVLTYDAETGTLYAVGTGTATLTVGDTSYAVNVSPAPLSIFMITGHSIGAGQEGNGTQSVVVEAGQAYSSYHQNSLDVTKVDGYGLGYGSENRVGVSGIMRWDSYGQLDAFAPGEGGNTGAGSGFAYRWNQLTGEKVWVINIAVGGSCVNEWMPGASGHSTSYDNDYYGQTISKFSYAQTILKNEVAAGHYSLRHQGILNFSGYNFSWYSNWSQESLRNNYESLWNAYTQELGKTDIDGDGVNDGLDVFAISVAWANGNNLYDRPATWYMGTSEAFPHITLSTAGTLDWNADLSTFPAIDYTTQSVAPYMPESRYHTDQGGTSDNSLLCQDDTTHYSQVGYNAIGLDMGKNLADYFNSDAGSAPVTSLRLEDYQSKLIPDSVTLSAGATYLITPVVEPVTVSNLTYEVTGNAELTYPLAVKATKAGSATLTVKQGDRVLKTVQFTVTPAHTHCECGGKLTGVAAQNHACGEALTYVPLNRECFTNYRYNTYNSSTQKLESTSTAYVLRSGNYYLSDDYSMSSSIYIAPDSTVNLCLNGHTLTVANRVFRPNGNFNICDCSEHGTGSVYADTANTAPILYSYSGSVVNFYGGSYSSAPSSKREFAGCISVGNDMGLYDVDINGDGVHNDTDKLTGEVNIYAGTFYGSDLACSDGSPTGKGAGACLYVVNKESTLNIYGGEFVGASCVLVDEGGKGGGGIIGSSGNTNIFGGIFRNSTDSSGAIWTDCSRLHISGSPVFENNTNADIFLHHCDHLYIDAPGLSVQTPIRVTGSSINWTKIHLSKAADAEQLVGVHGVTMGTPDSDLIMKYTRDNTYCVCGGTVSQQIKDLSCHVCADATWSALQQSNFSSVLTTTNPDTSAGTSTGRYYPKSREVWYYLASNVNLTNEIEIPDGYTFHLDLNGYTLSHSTGSNAVLRVFGDLTVCDSSQAQTGKIVGVRTGTSEASAIYVLNKNSDKNLMVTPRLDLFSGTLTGYNITSNTNRTRTVAKQAGVLQIGNNSASKDAVFNMYGGTITGGIASSSGGNVYLGHGIMNMYDGTITNGTSTASYGGNLRVGSGNTFTMYGGTIQNGTCQGGSGGNIFISDGNNRILGGTIAHGWASNNGGNLYVGSGDVTLKNVKLDTGCALQGGNVFVNAGSLEAVDCQLLNGKGGYKFSRNPDGTMRYTDDGSAHGNAGNLYVNNASATVTNCLLTDGTSLGRNNSDGFGGNSYNKGTLIMDGCTVTGGNGYRGGVVGIRDNGNAASVTELKNCTFYDNGASVGGSSVSLWANAKGASILIDNCTFDDTETYTRWGVISVTDNACESPITLTVKDTTIRNLAENAQDAYGIYMAEGQLTLDGTCSFETADADIYLDKNTVTGEDLEYPLAVADSFTSEKPVTVLNRVSGFFGTAAVGKETLFTGINHSISNDEGILYANGLFQTQDGGKYATIAQALENGNVLTLLADHTGNHEITDDLWLNLNGFTMIGDITGSGTLYGYDTSSDDYKAPDGRIEGTVSCNVAKHFKGSKADIGDVKRYMAISDETGYTFHRFYLGVTHTTINTAKNGVGYKAVFYADDAVKGEIKDFGYTLQLAEGFKPVTKTKKASELVSGNAVTLRVDNFDVANFGKTELSASVFFTLNDDSKIESAPISRSMKTIMESVNAIADKLTDAQLSGLHAMIAANAEAMKDWAIDAIRPSES